jgi:hypothetical protein
MIRILLLLLVALSACGAQQPLRVNCERRLVPINEPIEQIDDSRLDAQPQDEGRRP